MSDWVKGQILELISSGAISKGKKVTVVRDFSQSDRERGSTVTCSFQGSNYEITSTHLVEVKSPMWKKGQPAVIIESGAISRGTYVTVEKDFNVEDIKRGNNVQCNYKGETFYVTPHHLGDPN
jgi:hypothetical protein